MSYPNNDLAVWQLVLLAVVAMVTLIGWLTAVYLADRHPGRSDRAAGAAGAAGQGMAEAGKEAGSAAA